MALSLKDKALILFNKEILINEQVEAFEAIRDLVVENLTAYREELQKKANDTDDKINQINSK